MDRAEGKSIYPNYNLMQARRNSRMFSNILITQYKSGNISGTDLSQLLGIKLNNLTKYELHI